MNWFGVRSEIHHGQQCHLHRYIPEKPRWRFVMGSEKPLSTSMMEESQANVNVIRRPLQVSCSSFAMRLRVSRVKREDSQRNWLPLTSPTSTCRRSGHRPNSTVQRKLQLSKPTGLRVIDGDLEMLIPLVPP